MNLYWVRLDFRVTDNIALNEILKSIEKNKALFIYNKKKFTNKTAQRWWLSKTLLEFEKNLKLLKIDLDILIGDEFEILNKYVISNKIKNVYFNRIFEPNEINLEEKLKKNLKNVKIHIGNSNLLQNPFSIKKKDGTPFQVYTPFWKNAEIYYLNNNIIKNFTKKKINQKIQVNNKNQNIIEENILPKKKWFDKFEKYWKPGEDEALKLIQDFFSDRIKKYAHNRDIPSIDGTSKLSPYLSFGEITAEMIYSYFKKINNKNINHRKYINEIGWREFSHHLLNHFPKIENSNLRKQFDNFNWSNNKDNLKKWKNAQTGYPIVDAGITELNETGWMHNRIRMITASFLVKHLRIHWKEGENFFRDSLLDFNVANNVSGWQWVAGCGADAAPYFRIFNPILQGEKFDSEGEYIKKWIPSLKSVPKKYIHKPWELDADTAKKINFDIERDYYKPIVDHKMARDKALIAFKELKSK
ncbi:MAG: deoxyribodipyrimidine photolyase [Candidatus Pelagibacter sp.]|nr:deoxyribodipyrimidine photolyase [Candidatus Pelagibacter sp.]OUV97482.1 MAG: deoxyribodipyrimidine photolyase [Candidatus Pelagibacter sp. TMED142]